MIPPLSGHSHGRRQIGEFLLPGDLFGWEGAGEHAFGAEAVTGSRLRRVRLDLIEERAGAHPGFARALRAHAATRVRAAGERVVLLGRKAALERIADFLLQMDERLPRSGSAIELPMGRADIADYLGLTTETVCRGLSELRRHRVIDRTGTRIKILNHKQLSVGRRCA